MYHPLIIVCLCLQQVIIVENAFSPAARLVITSLFVCLSQTYCFNTWEYVPYLTSFKGFLRFSYRLYNLEYDTVCNENIVDIQVAKISAFYFCCDVWEWKIKITRSHTLSFVELLRPLSINRESWSSFRPGELICSFHHPHTQKV